MQPSEALSVVAQVAVTLAGFAGIVVVFRPASIHHWSALDKFRLQLLLANSALPLAFSLVGMLLLTINPPPPAIWRWCSGVALVIEIAFLIIGGGPRPRIPVAEFQTGAKTMYYSTLALACVALILQVINIVVWNRFWPFFAVLFVHLIAAIAQFVRMLLLSPPAESR